MSAQQEEWAAVAAQVAEEIHAQQVVTITAESGKAVAYAPFDTADLIVCMDALGRVDDPEHVLIAIATRARIGCVLLETTATYDADATLPANQGWHPGHLLERHGWTCTDTHGRARVWHREHATHRPSASLLLCAYRSVSAEAMQSILSVVTGSGTKPRIRVKVGDALIARSRSIIVSGWYRETADDVFLMLDDDIVFYREDVDRLIHLCRNGHDIICAGYPVHSGEFLACRTLPTTTELACGPGNDPIEIQYAATGCMAVHRRVIEALIADLPLCHGNQPWAFWPLFQTMILPNPGTGGYEWLSEDFGFSELAHRAGFRLWLDPATVLVHLGQAGVSIRNMQAHKQAQAYA